MDSYAESEVIKTHLPCPDCGSHDALSLYSDSHTYCYSCKVYRKGSGEQGGERKIRKPHAVIPLEDIQFNPLRKRGITQTTCEKFHYGISKENGETVQVACYYENGELTGQKIRWANKDFRIYGSVGDCFFGQHLFMGGGKKVIVTEGEIDCLTVSQVFGNKYPVVSVPKGAGSAKKTFKAQLEWLETFEEVVVIFDMDTAGREAIESVKGIVSPGKLKIVELPLKDPNEMLLANRSEELVRAVWQAEPYKPEGIVQGSSLFEKIYGLKDKTKGVPLPWNIKLNEMIAGLRQGEITLFTAGSGIGKSTVVRAIAHYLGVVEDTKVGMLFLEEQPEQTAQKLMSIEAGIPLHLEPDRLSKAEQKAIFERTLGKGNFVFYDHFGSVAEDNLINKMRYMAVSEGCKFLILDHISIAVSGIEGDNDRKIIDTLMTKLAVLTQETGVGILVVSHLRKTDSNRKSHEEGAKITLDDLRGSGALKQLSFTVIALERNQQDEDERAKNVIHVRVLKCRFTGQTGSAGYLWYNAKTDRLEAIHDLDAFLAFEEADEEEPQGEENRKVGDF